MKLQAYFEQLRDTYGESVNLIPSQNKEELSQVPQVLWECYETIEKATFPFGRIYTIEEALKESSHLPFKGEWFVFGQDNFFSFWLCRYQQDHKGCNFTAWDHSSGSAIGEAADEELVKFLAQEDEEYREQKQAFDEWEEEED